MHERGERIPLERLLLDGQAAFELTDRFEQPPVDQHRFAVLGVELERSNQTAFDATQSPLAEDKTVPSAWASAQLSSIASARWASALASP